MAAVVAAAVLACVGVVGCRVFAGSRGPSGRGSPRLVVPPSAAPPGSLPPPPLEGVPGGRADGTASYVDDSSARRPGWRPWTLALAPDRDSGCLDDVYALYCTGLPGPPGTASVGRVSIVDGSVGWRRDLPGVLVGVFGGDLVAADPVGEGQVAVTAYDTRDGSVRWSTRVAGVAGAATLGDGLVLVASAHGLTAVALADGSVRGRWPSPFAQLPDGHPLVRFADHRAYLAIAAADTSDVVVVDPNRADVQAATRLPVAVSGSTGFAVRDGVVHAAAEGADGARVVVWDSTTGATAAVPLGVGPLTEFALTGDVYVVALGDRVRAVRVSDHAPLWEHVFASPPLPGALWCVGGRVYAVSADEVTALDAATGDAVWRTAAPADAPGVAQGTVSGGVLFVRLPGGGGTGPCVRAVDVFSP